MNITRHLVPVGYAKSEIAAPPRRELDELIHYENYDSGRYRDDEAIARFIRTLTLQGAYGRRGTGD